MTLASGNLVPVVSRQSSYSNVLMAAGDTFRAAAGEQLEVWAQRTGSEIVMGDGPKPRPAAVLSQAVRRGVEEDFDVVLCDTSGRLHTNFNLMEELRGCKRAVSKTLPSAPNEVLLVLDGTTGLNMLPQAREFNQVVGPSWMVQDEVVVWSVLWTSSQFQLSLWASGRELTTCNLSMPNHLWMLFSLDHFLSN